MLRGYLFGVQSTAGQKEISVRDYKFIRALMFVPISLILTLTSCGGDNGGSVTTSRQFTEVSAQVSVTSTGFLYSRISTLYTGTLTITNNGGVISGTIDVALSNLTPGVTLANSVGTYQGAPYVTATTIGMAAGDSITVPIQFSDPSNAKINFSPMTYQE